MGKVINLDENREGNWKKSTARFTLDGEKKSFEIVHNLADGGYLFTNILTHWLAETEIFTDRSFCDYVNSKEHITGCRALTIEEFETMFRSNQS